MLKDVVKEAGLTYKQLANYLETSESNVKNWFRDGFSAPDTVEKLVAPVVEQEFIKYAIFKFDEDFNGKRGISFTLPIRKDEGIYVPEMQWFKELTVRNIRDVFQIMEKYQNDGYKIVILT